MEPASPVIPNIDVDEVVYAKDQPEYNPLPSVRLEDGRVLTRWLLTPKERQQVLQQGYVYLTVHTFNQPLQPLMMTVDAPNEFLENAWPEIIQ